MIGDVQRKLFKYLMSSTEGGWVHAQEIYIDQNKLEQSE